MPDPNRRPTRSYFPHYGSESEQQNSVGSLGSASSSSVQRCRAIETNPQGGDNSDVLLVAISIGFSIQTGWALFKSFDLTSFGKMGVPYLIAFIRKSTSQH